MAAAGKAIISTTLRVEEELYRRVKSKLGAEGSTLQDKVTAWMEEYVNGSSVEREAFRRQMAIAERALERYAPALRELAQR